MSEENVNTEEKLLLERTQAAKASIGGKEIVRICIEDESGNKRYGFFKMPDRNIVGIAMAKMKFNNVEAIDILLKNTILKKFSDVDIDDDADFWALANESGEFLRMISEKKSSSTRF